MTRKHTMSDDEARTLIDGIRQRCRGLAGNYEYFDDPDAVCELVEATLMGVGYDRSWVVGPFSDMLRKAVEQHQLTVARERERASAESAARMSDARRKKRGLLVFFAEARGRHRRYIGG